MPRKKENRMPVWLMTMVLFNLSFRVPKSTSIPMTNIKSTNPNWLISSRLVRDSGRNRKLKKSGYNAPKTEGPITMPATISPMTLGCRSHLNRSVKIRTVSRITMICSNRMPSGWLRLSCRMFTNMANALLLSAVSGDANWWRCPPARIAA